MSEFIRNNTEVNRGVLVRFSDIYGPNQENSLRDLHLYFLKLLGCYAVEYDVPLPLKSFAVAILMPIAHPQLFLDFVAMPSAAENPQIIVGEIRGLQRQGRLVGATWFYTVGTLGVAVAYSERVRPSGSWHPDDNLDYVRLK